MCSKNISEFRPLFFNRKDQTEDANFTKLIDETGNLTLLDHYEGQKKELFKVRNPASRLSDQELDQLFSSWSSSLDVSRQGVWVYYPWSQRLLHLLEKDEFIELRTSRNKHKITTEEQQTLLTKKLGIIGLSVGHAVALTLATERACSSMKLADFDTLELSNLNRIRTGLHNIGLNKCIITAREIAEIDPFIDIECFTDGITADNLDEFVLGGGKLDILIDECDDIGVKILCRQKAKQLSIPVVMETSDRGMLDVERFDLDSELLIFHGMLADIPAQILENIGPEQRLPIVMKIVDAFKSSARAQASLLELGHTITTWPQLASAVTLGGGVVTDVCRRMLLGHFTDSGRYYVDLEGIISNKTSPASVPEKTEFDFLNAIKIAEALGFKESGVELPASNLERIITSSASVFSEYNNQPWKWLYHKGHFHVFLNTADADSFTNFNNIASDISLASASEYLLSELNDLGFNAEIIVANEASLPLFASIVVTGEIDTKEEETEKSSQDKNSLSNASETLSSQFPLELHAALIEDPEKKKKVISLLSQLEVMVLLNKAGHEDIFSKYMKWPDSGNGVTSYGIDFLTLPHNPVQKTAFMMLRNPKVANAMKVIGSNKLLLNTFEESLFKSNSIGYLRMPLDKLATGRAIQSISRNLVAQGLILEPIMSPTALFGYLESGEVLDNEEITILKNIKFELLSLLNSEEELDRVLFFKILPRESSINVSQQRRQLNDILYIAH